MQEVNAAGLATELIKLMIQHQTNPALLPPSALGSDEQAKKAAQAIATLRQELIERLKQQP